MKVLTKDVCIGDEHFFLIEDDDKVVRVARKVLMEYFSRDEKIAELVKQKIRSLKRDVFEGSREWEILYKKYYEEESKKNL